MIRKNPEIVRNNLKKRFQENKIKIFDELIKLDDEFLDLKKEIISKIRERIGTGFEVSLSLASGNGKEHMALMSALLKLGIGIRFIALTKEGVEEI